MVSEYQKIRNWERMKSIAITSGMSIALGSAIYGVHPHKTVTEFNYVVPSKIEIMTKDLNKDGDVETILKYDGKDYLFILNKEGTPTCKEIDTKY